MKFARGDKAEIQCLHQIHDSETEGNMTGGVKTPASLSHFSIRFSHICKTIPVT